MATVQNKHSHHEKEQTLLRKPVKRLMRERPLDAAAPIKKRVMAALNLSCRKVAEAPSPPKPAAVKTEHAEKDAPFPGYHAAPKAKEGLDLSPALRHTLAQFTLSSQCSLGGPAAFAGAYGHERPAPSLGQCGVAVGPLLVPPDSSTELALCDLEGESISCFSVGGELRLCLPQVLNTVLRHFSLQQINAVCDQLYVYCSRCNAPQLHVLKALGVLPAGAPSCGLITLTDAQRLCHALLHPGDDAPPADRPEDRDAEDAGGFWVEHQCLGKCQGLFVPRLYAGPGAPCIRCSQCRQLFCPRRFVMHSHRQPDKRTCHWGFDSAKWGCYLQLGRRYLDTADEGKLKQLLEAMKLKFSPITLDTKQLESARLEEGLNLCSGKERLGSEGKMAGLPAYAFEPCLVTDLKDDPRQLDLMWQSWYLYMHDKMMGSGPVPGPERDPETRGGPEVKRTSQDGEDPEPKTSASAGSKRTKCPTGQSQRPGLDERPRVSIETPACEKQENKDSMVVEVLQMYNAQHEELQSTLLKQQQLEKELQALRKVEPGELEAAQAEHAQKLGEVQMEHAHRLGEVQEEQRRLKCRLEQLRQQQGCRCRELQGAEQQQESRYAAQLSELRQRLDRAEEDREELQEELRREREAREKLERIISELKLQMKESAPVHGLLTSPAP